MRRLDVPELHDYAWCPKVVRDGLTDFLEVAIETLDTYGPIRGDLIEALERCRCREVVDLCSGAGGPWLGWLNRGLVRANITLTDKFPNQRTRQRLRQLHIPELSFASTPVDAAAVPPELKGFRTIFSAFHHFSPALAQRIIEDAVASSQPIGIFELTSRTPAAIFAMFLSAIGVWWLTPRMRPIDWKKWLLTYLVPVIPLVVLADGIASCVRSYSPEELRHMAAAINGTYLWKAGTTGGRAPVTYLIGYPG